MPFPRSAHVASAVAAADLMERVRRQAGYALDVVVNVTALDGGDANAT